MAHPFESEGFDPPALVARATLRNPQSGAFVENVPMLLDTGADISDLPESILKAIALIPVLETGYQLASFDGQLQTARIVSAELHFEHVRTQGDFAVIDTPCGIIGRDILRGVTLVADGPNQTWELRV